MIRKFHFTVKKIEALPPNDRDSKSTDQEYSDTIPGLKLFVSKNGRKSFHFRYCLNNKKRVIKIGDFDCIPLGEVRDIASKYRGMVNKNIDPLAKRDTAKELPTLREFSKTYIEWARFHKRSWKDDDNKLKADILPAFGERKLNGITGKEIQLYLEKIKTRTSGSCSNRPELLSSGYQWKGTAIITNKIGSPTNGKYAAPERRRAMTTCLGARQRRSGSGPC